MNPTTTARCPIHNCPLEFIGSFDGEHSFECPVRPAPDRKCSFSLWRPIRPEPEAETTPEPPLF